MDRQQCLTSRDAIRAQLLELEPNLLVTHNFWGTYQATTQCDRMKGFYSAIQRDAFGRDWAKQTDREWPEAWGFREHPNSNPHYHVLVRCCARLAEAIKTTGPAVWEKMARHGQLDVQEIGSDELPAVIYSSAHLTHEQAFDDMFLYSDIRGLQMDGSWLAPPQRKTACVPTEPGATRHRSKDR